MGHKKDRFQKNVLKPIPKMRVKSVLLPAYFALVVETYPENFVIQTIQSKKTTP